MSDVLRKTMRFPCAFHMYPLRIPCVTPEMEGMRVIAKIAILADTSLFTVKITLGCTLNPKIALVNTTLFKGLSGLTTLLRCPTEISTFLTQSISEIKGSWTNNDCILFFGLSSYRIRSIESIV
jgi:hypothetical protein